MSGKKKADQDAQGRSAKPRKSRTRAKGKRVEQHPVSLPDPLANPALEARLAAMEGNDRVEKLGRLLEELKAAREKPR